MRVDCGVCRRGFVPSYQERLTEAREGGCEDVEGKRCRARDVQRSASLERCRAVELCIAARDCLRCRAM